MASTFTTNFGIEKIGTGEQSGTWGTTTNYNIDILDRITSYKSVTLSDAATATLTVRAGSPSSGSSNLSDGMYRVIKFGGTLSQACTITIAPSTTTAYFIIQNGTSGSQNIIMKQGSGAQTVTIAAGKADIVYADASDEVISIGSKLGVSFDVVDDTSPQLGGNLDMNGQDIVTTSNADIELAPNGTGKTVLKGNTNPGTMVFNCESNSHGQTVKSQPHSASVTNVLTLPPGSDQEIVGTSATQTLTNKTINASQLSGTVALARLSDASTSAKGIASFSSDNFDVSSGAVTIKDQGVALAEIVNVTATDKILGRSSSGAGTIEEISCTSAGRALLDDANASAQRTTLGLAIGSDVQAFDSDTAKTDVTQSFTAPQRNALTVDNDGSFDLNAANNFKCTPSGNFTLTFTNIPDGQSGFILLINSGGHTVSLHANSKGSATIAATLSAAGTYLVSYLSDGTNVYLTNSVVYA